MNSTGKIKELPSRNLTEGISGHYAHGKQMSFGYVTIARGSILPDHHHIHEQITYILSGELEMTIGDQTVTLTEGMFYVIPSNTPHSAVAHRDCVVIDVFSPVREEYKEGL